MWTSTKLRQSFLDFFAEQGHTIVPSSSLVPANDPTLLFTNAGMVQFKDVFLGLDKRPYTKAVSVQRCVRAGGKHNDLENVGYTARHHTFFEMLGNFSFGDYFKREAIQYSWNYITDVLKIPKEKLWVTVFEEDDEAADIWLNDIKVSKDRFSRCGAKDNFWSMGDTGPCGPCTEIFYDHGPEIPGGPPGSIDSDGDRYIEIWNLVFMQFNRAPNGDLSPLPKPSVDTGMGFERLVAVMQGVHNNYDTDLFVPLIKAIIALLPKQKTENVTSLQVIADHIRSSSFLITDGVIPSNEGRGYVLRRIIRRAIRHGYQLGLQNPFFYKLVKTLVEIMGKAYPELAKAQPHIERVLQQEEEQFSRTLEQGMKILEQDLQKLSGKVISGSTVFKLYDTYGFPVDLTADIARERDLVIDHLGFEMEMAKQKRQSQEASKFSIEYRGQLPLESTTDFTGYEFLEHTAAITDLLKADGQPVEELMPGDSGIVVLDRTPFYAEGGGQIGDQGILEFPEGSFKVMDTRRQGQTYLHYGQVKSGTLKKLMPVHAKVNKVKRQATRLNHSATHLLHAALRRVLGDHVTQKGSLVAPDRLRFDFSHYEALTHDQIKTIEHLVNQEIRANHLATTEIMTPDQAIKTGAMALFGEKYGEEVRVLHMGDFSVEVCGGTHVQSTGDIGLFKIILETGIAAGVRRIEAVTGEYALDWIDKISGQLQQIAELTKSDLDNALDKIKLILDRNRTFEKQISELKSELTSSKSGDLIKLARTIRDIKVLALELRNVDAKTLREMVDQLKQKMESGVIVLASVTEGRVNLIVGVTKNCIAKVDAQELMNFIADQIGAKGGGRPDLAQAGGEKPEQLARALNSVYSWIDERLAGESGILSKVKQ